MAVDPLNTTARTVALPEPADARVLDLRLRAGLDPAGPLHAAEAGDASWRPASRSTLADAAGGRFEAYDSLAKVYGLYATLTHDPKLAEFAFVLNWPKLKPEEKRALYSKYACHELNFFLAQKDPEFFAAVVQAVPGEQEGQDVPRPLAAGATTSAGYRDPWRYERLNTVERVLLAQRVAGEPAATARHLNDLLRLQPPPVDRIRGLFETRRQERRPGRHATRWGSKDKLKEFNAPMGRPGRRNADGRLRRRLRPAGAGRRPAAPMPESAAAAKPAEGKARSETRDDATQRRREARRHDPQQAGSWKT